MYLILFAFILFIPFYKINYNYKKLHYIINILYILFFMTIFIHLIIIHNFIWDIIPEKIVLDNIRYIEKFIFFIHSSTFSSIF